MSAINFVARDSAGNISRGFVGADGGSSSIGVGVGADVSLNVTQGQIVSYTRQGQALQIVLIDGRVITIEGYFSPEGAPQSQLFLSADGYLTEVDLASSGGADYFANYIGYDGAGKFSLNDDMYFMRGADVMRADTFVPAGNAGIGGLGLGTLLGLGAAAVGAAAIINNNNDNPAAPPLPSVTVTSGVKSTGDVVNEDDYADGVDIGGTGTPGATVEVEIEGKTETALVDEDGNWTVSFDKEDIREGEYETFPVNVTVTNENGTNKVTETLVVDTVIGVTLDATGGDDGVINGTEFGDQVQLTGTVTGSNAVVVTIDGTDYDAVVTYDEETNTGTWTLDVPTTVMGAGEYTKEVTVKTTDAAGNTRTVTGDVVVDTLIGLTAEVANDQSTAPTAGDGVVNAAEFGDGVRLAGTVTGNDAVTVTIGDQTLDATVTYNEETNEGTWELLVPTTLIPEGEGSYPVKVTTTDAAQNTSSQEVSVVVDTLIGVTMDPTGGADGVINGTEFGDQVQLTGTVTGSSAVVVTIDGTPYDAVVTYNEETNTGTWTLDVPTSVIGAGEYTKAVTVSTSDAAGNTSTVTNDVVVDTLIGVTAEVSNDQSTAPFGGDGVVNATEYGDGVLLTGTVTGNNSVVVTVGGQPLDANVTYDEGTNEGTWTLLVPTTLIPQGEGSYPVSVTTTDAAQNTASQDFTVEVDTLIGVTGGVDGDANNDGTLNAAEFGNGVMLSGTVTGNGAVSVTIGTQTYPANVTYNEATNQGTWTLAVPTTVIGTGESTQSVTVSTTDSAQNTASQSFDVKVDTLIDVTGNPTGGADNVINLTEFGTGVVLTGSVTGNDTVSVQIGPNASDTFPATVVYDDVSNTGTWSLSVPTSVMGGVNAEYIREVTITTTDPAGNSDRAVQNVEVDTWVNELTIAQPIAGNDVVNRDEAQNLTLSGTVEASEAGELPSSVQVTISSTQAGFQNVVEDATVVGGSWTLNLKPGQLPDGDYAATATVVATDVHGNVSDPLPYNFRVDTVVPEAPTSEGVFTSTDGGEVDRILVETQTGTVTMSEVTDAHEVNDLSSGLTAVPVGNMSVFYNLDDPLSNGSHLIISVEDSAGNTNSTFLVLEETATDVVDLGGLGGQNIGSIELGVAKDSELTLDLAAYENIVGDNNKLLVRGDADDDTVTLIGAQSTGNTETIGDVTYNEYTIGTEGRILVDDEINQINTPVI